MRLTRWSARRHCEDTLPLTVARRRIYIVPTRFGIALALLLAAMLLAALNYNSNLALAFGFLMSSLALVAMHHCHRNLLGLSVNVGTQADAFAEGVARFDFVLRNTAALARCDIEIRIGGEAEAVATHSIAANSYQRVGVDVSAPRRGVTQIRRFELRTRYPFGWFRAWTYVQSPLTVFVAPQPRGNRTLPSAASTTGMASHSEWRGHEDFAGLRAYEPGVALKHMAWKVLARGGEPAVRAYTGLAARPQWLDWSSLAGLDVESRLSQLCLWVLESEAASHVYGLRMPGTAIVPAAGTQHRLACLRALAAHGGAQHPDSTAPS